jgi:hypothetical protein
MNDFTSLLKPMVDALAGRNQKIICWQVWAGP